MRTAAWLYLFKHYTLKDWVAFAEVYGMPLRLGKYQPGASAEDREALLRAVRAIGHDAAGIISSSTEMEFVHASQRQGPDLYEALIALCNKELAQAILGQTLTSDVGAVGSFAAAKVHEEVRQDLIEADATALGETLTQQLVRPLTGFNLGWDVPAPTLAFVVDTPQDQEADAKVLVNLTQAGFGPAIPLAIVHERFGIRPPKDGEPVVGAAGPAAARARAGPAALTRLALADSPARQREAALLAGVAPIEAMAEAAVTGWEDWMAPILEPVRRLLAESATLEEAKARVLLAYGEMDDAALTDLLARAMFVSDVWGRLHG